LLAFIRVKGNGPVPPVQGGVVVLQPGEAEDNGIMPRQLCFEKGQGLCMWPDSQMGYDIVCHKAGEVTVGEVQRLGFLKPVTPEAKSGDKSTVDTG